MKKITYADISEVIADSERPWLDRMNPPAVPRASKKYTREIEEWRTNGVVHLPGFLPEALIEDYCKLRAQTPSPRAWECPVPYMYYSELRNICLYTPLMDVMHALIGFRMGLHLNLTWLVSTERALHADDYLNPPFVNSHYCAVWMALDDIVPESGPFQYVPGSHRWPTIRRHKIFEQLDHAQQNSHAWPVETQEWVEAACLEEIERRGEKLVSYTPKRGDVLIWHGCLLHRGSKPQVPGTPRKALISHYSSIDHRPDWPEKKKWKGEWYFVHRNAMDEGGPAANV